MDFEQMYKNIITDPRYIHKLIEDGTFEDWLHIQVDEDLDKHINSLKRLKEVMIEHEMYENLKIVDDTITEYKIKLTQ